MCKYKHSAICMQYENCKSAISEIWKYLKNFQSCHFLIKTLEILSSKGKPHGIKMVKLKDAGDQNLDKFDKLTTYVYYFGEGKDSSVCGNCWGITHTRHTHTHTLTHRLFLLCLQHVSSLLPANTILQHLPKIKPCWLKRDDSQVGVGATCLIDGLCQATKQQA